MIRANRPRLSHFVLPGVQDFRSYYTHLSGKRDGAGSLTTEGVAPAANPLLRHYKCVERTG